MPNKNTQKRNDERHRAAQRTGRVRASESMRKRDPMPQGQKRPDPGQGKSSLPPEQK
jgi:hypothetical protein